MPVPLRGDFDAAELCRLARRTKDGPQARRLLTLAAIYDGATRTEASKIGDVTLQIVRDWVVKFNAQGPDALIDKKAPGQASRCNDMHRAALAKAIDEGPIPAIHGVARWRLVDLAQWIFEEFRISISVQTLSRELRALGYRRLSARPRHHAQAEGAIEEYKKLPRPLGCDRTGEGHRTRAYRGLVRRRGAHRPEEQDHATLGSARDQDIGALRPAHCLDLHLRRHVPRQGRRPRPAFLQHRGDELAPRRDRHAGGARRPCRALSRSGRLASVEPARGAGQHHARAAAAQMPGAQPGQERLGVHARELALQPHLQILRGHPRPLLLRLEQARRSTLEDHVHRNTRLGPIGPDQQELV
jgi:transposase